MKKDTKFKPGQSGNPGGRPVGVGNAIRAQLTEAWEQIRPVLLEKAKEGDMAAIRIVAERVCAPVKAMEAATPFALPEGSLTEKAEAVIKAMADGDIATGQAAQILQGLGAMAKIAETDELERRIAALEEKNAST